MNDDALSRVSGWLNDWQVDEDLRRAKQLIADHSTKSRSAMPTDFSGHDARLAASQSVMPTGVPLAIPIQPRAVWSPGNTIMPLLFGFIGLLGGTLAVLISQIMPAWFPAVLVAELGVGILLAIAFGRITFAPSSIARR